MSATGGSLTLTVPVGWQVVDLDGLLGDAVAEAMIEALGDELGGEEREALHEAFRDLHQQVEADHVVFMALRVDEGSGAQEVMTLALPGDAAPPIGSPTPPPGPAAAAGTDAGSEPRPHAIAPERPPTAVRLGEGSAIVHASVPTADGGSWTQLVFFLPGTREGAILTSISSASDRAEALKRDAIAVVRSLEAPAEGGGAG